MSKTLLIMAAGTGGHVMPGLAIAKAMQARGWNVHWLGTVHGMENRLVPPHGLPMTQLKFSGLRGKGWMHTVTGICRLVSSTLAAWRLMKQLKPQAVLGMGGYVTVPGGWAARTTGVPLALVNADAGLLMSNRALVKHAERVLFGFEGGETSLGAGAFKARVTGNPVRAEIVDIAPPEQRFANRSGRLHLLVVGGSLGAQVLNHTLPKALALLPAEQRPVVTHQSGAQHIASLREAYMAAGVEANVVPFIDDMASAYAEADVLVCRAGAITVSELAVAGVASILVPLVVSTTSHQRDNARWMAEHNAAIHLPQQEMTAQKLAGLLQGLTRSGLLAIAHAARELGRPNATEAIANELESIALPEQGGNHR
ncbi:undecaprenyldiphospho-muramoylpentapeptide beta-N-acetylglucosaminyltransferase [Methylobacillus gramineus]|uniref:undecaprenyldiphospho-muramoylpentapeptide beta-N-acetylglucosaminyltransferase n=1 Tax=Methylobacillus gramineus TaxID=755169 RepID=UPI001D000A75|nr:undecaprenyldiphospho-muramoylpentapeptide beta-N-acetylglucosaminyltransferase [Methylobacillus gramineus]MCB5186204.1 undecaprenyldiphospho-muramoylpentapeptide beta-N-acetylglucosaminyltransferase [Methylobacillus gramineus]